VSLVPAASALIRQAAVDDRFAQDLYHSVQADDAFEGIVNASISEGDLPWLTPSEWLWFSVWRQALGGPLDARLLEYLERTTVDARAARFQLRGLVMRDPRTEDAATSDADAAVASAEPGLSWLRAHARSFPDSAEVARDALQYATQSAWFVLRVLTATTHPHAGEVEALLDQFARERELGPEVTRFWRSPDTTLPSTPQARGRRVVGPLSDRLQSVAERLRNATSVIGARLEPISVLGSEVPVRPFALVLPPEAESVLIADAQTRATVGGGSIHVWMSGRWVVPDGTRIAVFAVASTGEVSEDEAVLAQDARLRFVLDWNDPVPPDEILIAVVES
jgi:hypothetical protein